MGWRFDQENELCFVDGVGEKLCRPSSHDRKLEISIVDHGLCLLDREITEVPI